MSTMKHPLAFLAAVSLLALAACGDDQAANAGRTDPPQATEPAPGTPEKPALETAREGIDTLRDAANQAIKDAQPAIDRARESAGKVLEEIRPTIEQLGTSIGEITRRAQEDFAKGVEALDRRLDDARSDGPLVTGDPAATLAAPDKLRTDTRAAARASAAGVGPGHVGVWVARATDCVRVDQEPLEMLAIVTPTTIRRYESVCNMPETPLTDGSATIEAQCVIEGEVETQTLKFALASPDRLTLSGAQGPGVDLVRCHLPR